jgi:hypothetical protein
MRCDRECSCRRGGVRLLYGAVRSAPARQETRIPPSRLVTKCFTPTRSLSLARATHPGDRPQPRQEAQEPSLSRGREYRRYSISSKLYTCIVVWVTPRLLCHESQRLICCLRPRRPSIRCSRETCHSSLVQSHACWYKRNQFTTRMTCKIHERSPCPRHPKLHLPVL